MREFGCLEGVADHQFAGSLSRRNREVKDTIGGSRRPGSGRSKIRLRQSAEAAPTSPRARVSVTDTISSWYRIPCGVNQPEISKMIPSVRVGFLLSNGPGCSVEYARARVTDRPVKTDLDIPSAGRVQRIQNTAGSCRRLPPDSSGAGPDLWCFIADHSRCRKAAACKSDQRCKARIGKRLRQGQEAQSTGMTYPQYPSARIRPHSSLCARKQRRGIRSCQQYAPTLGVEHTESHGPLGGKAQENARPRRSPDRPTRSPSHVVETAVTTVARRRRAVPRSRPCGHRCGHGVRRGSPRSSRPGATPGHDGAAGCHATAPLPHR
jgi:hypothetical protein